MYRRECVYVDAHTRLGIPEELASLSPAKMLLWRAMVLDRAHAINFVERSKTPTSEDVVSPSVRPSGSSEMIDSNRNLRVGEAKQRNERELRGKGLTIHFAG